MGTWATFGVPSSVGTFSPDTALLLTDGSVLIHDSFGANWVRLTPDSKGNYETGTWSPLLPMTIAREFFASGVLRDGRVFVVGGEYGPGQMDVTSAEIFDPKINSWSAVTKPDAFNYIQGDASGCVLADGRVLLGNLQTTSPPFSTALWDPVNNNEWTVAGSKFGSSATDTKQAVCNEETWTLLPDGSILTVQNFATPPTLTQRYVPSLDEWVSTGKTPNDLVLTTVNDASGAAISVYEIGPALLLPDGRVFAIGGTGNTALYTPPPHGSDPTITTGSWLAGPSLPKTPEGSLWPMLTTSDAPAVLQTNGKVLCTAGLLYLAQNDCFSENAQFFEFDPKDNSLNPFSPTPIPSASAPNTWQLRFLLLPTAQILMTTQSSTIYVYTPDANENVPPKSWKPTFDSCPNTLVQGHTYTVVGKQLNGLSQAVSYGDDAQQATNYPIFKLSNSSGAVVYLRSSNFSTLAVATGSRRVTADIDVGADVPTGAWQMVAIANGIPSDPLDVQVVAA
jgi:hypothetical protein